MYRGLFRFLPGGFAGALKDLILPDRCLVCGRYIQGIRTRGLGTCFCSHCVSGPLPFFVPPYCPSCGTRLKGRSDHLCESCLTSRSEIGRVRAAFAYEGVIRTAVAQLKYQGRMRLVRPLEVHLFDAFDRFFTEEGIDVIVPIPLHRKRAWKRGFNQAAVLVRNFPVLYAKRYGKTPDFRVQNDVLVRSRSTESQTHLSQSLREKNLNHAFSTGPKTAEVRKKHVLLVDDVYTSGATCKSAARTLLGAGADRVDALVLARA